MSFAQFSMFSLGINGQEQQIMLGIVLKSKERLSMLIISARSLFFFKVHTYRVSLSTGDLEDAKPPLGIRGLFINFRV